MPPETETPAAETTATTAPAETTAAVQTTSPSSADAFTPDPNKSEAENATAKQAFEKTRDDAKLKAEADKKAAETPEAKAAKEKADKEAAAKATADKANDTKANPFKIEEIKLPEGFQVDAPLQERFVKLVNEKGIPRDVVAELIPLQADAMKAASEASSKLFADTQAAWQKEAQNDPTIGGDKLAPVLATISKLVDQADDPAKLREVMDLTGFGNHPVAIKWLNKLSPSLTEPGAAVSGRPATSPQALADRIYDGKK